MAQRRKPRFFYGWILLPTLWILLGFGIAPGYYGWGFFMRDAAGMRQALALSDTEQGMVFSLFRFTFHLLGPVVAFAIARWGARRVISLGCLLTAAGYFNVARAETLLGCIVGFSVLAGAGVGLSTSVACQTVVLQWFLRYRARALAVLATSAGVVGGAVYWIDELALRHGDWRDGWRLLALVSVGLAVLAAVVVRDRPADMDQETDGAFDSSRGRVPGGLRRWWQAPLADPSGWTTLEALKTPAFVALTLVTMIDSLTWGVLAPFLPRHLDRVLEDLPPETAAATAVVSAILSARVWASVPGRLSAGVADFVSARLVLAFGLAMQGVGTGMLLVVHSRTTALLAVVLLGSGFGLTTASTPAAYAQLFGRRAFSGVVGTRFMITGFISPAAPWIVGFISDRTGSYSVSFLVLASACLAAAMIAAFLPEASPRRGPLAAGRGVR